MTASRSRCHHCCIFTINVTGYADHGLCWVLSYRCHRRGLTFHLVGSPLLWCIDIVTLDQLTITHKCTCLQVCSKFSNMFSLPSLTKIFVAFLRCGRSQEELRCCSLRKEILVGSWLRQIIRLAICPSNCLITALNVLVRHFLHSIKGSLILSWLCGWLLGWHVLYIGLLAQLPKCSIHGLDTV